MTESVVCHPLLHSELESRLRDKRQTHRQAGGKEKGVKEDSRRERKRQMRSLITIAVSGDAEILALWTGHWLFLVRLVLLSLQR